MSISLLVCNGIRRLDALPDTAVAVAVLGWDRGERTVFTLAIAFTEPSEFRKLTSSGNCSCVRRRSVLVWRGRAGRLPSADRTEST